MNPHRGGSRDRALLALAVVAVAGAVVLAAMVREGVAAGATDPPTPSDRRTTPAVAPAAAVAPMEDRTTAFVAFEGDPRAGQRVVMGAGRAGVGGACFPCHGVQGEGDSGGAFPRLAGQPAFYLYKQLTNYADGTRPNAIMSPIAVQMTQQERRDAAAYYSAARAAFRAPPADAPNRLQLGAGIAAVGSRTSGVQACTGCHGPGGSGVPPDVPYLAGQSVAYLELQLRLWHEARRTNDPLGVMADVARRLTPEERASVARYFAALAPPQR